MVRKIFGELAAQEFVSVQPMNLPSGLIFYLDFKYGTAQVGFTSGNDVFGITSGSGDPTGLYGEGRLLTLLMINDTSSTHIHSETVRNQMELTQLVQYLFKTLTLNQTYHQCWKKVIQ